MSNILSINGIPFWRATERVFFDTVKSDKPNDARQTKNITIEKSNTFTFREIEFVNWGNNNRFPDDAELLVHRTGVLQTALNYKSRCCYGQGVIPIVSEGLDENLKEIIKPFNNTHIINYLNDYTFGNYHISAFRDINKFGNCFPLLIPCNSGDKIVRIDALNARHCRLSKDKSKLLVYGGFSNKNAPSSDEKNCVLYDILDETDPKS